MSDRFICIACWQEFLVSPSERGARGGKVVCPHCGYIQTATSATDSSHTMAVADAGSNQSPMATGQGSASSRMAGPSAPSAVRNSTNEEATGTEENCDPEMGDESTSELPEVPESFEGEPTPPEGCPHSFSDVDVAEHSAPFSESAVVMDSVDEIPVYSSMDVIPESPAQFVWQLKTPSGLKLKFNDMGALLGWRQKVGGGSQAEISPDGQRWTDFASFVHQYEELGDPWRAFLRAANLSEDEPPPPPSSASQSSLRAITNASGDLAALSPPNGTRNVGGSRPGYSSDSLQNVIPKATAPSQFTFHVTQKQKPHTGKYFFLGVLGAALLAGAVLVLLHYSGQL